ncbi:MAG: glycine cleavage system protein H [Desulfurococcales archaeon ex4484_204]|nr:MAG: glycine cleavage system protein H [Desulfurococcales archaeon ex4484_204]
MGDIVVKTKLGEYLVKDGLLYTKTDEWVKVDGRKAVLGITDFAQKKLRYIVSVELPEVGRVVRANETIATLESVKTVADVYTPVKGRVVRANEDLIESPDLINKDPYGKGWIVELELLGELRAEELLTPEQYAGKIRSEEA